MPVREPAAAETLYALVPGQPFSFNLTVAQADTYAVAVWGRNSAGNGCAEVVVATGRDVVGLGGQARNARRRGAGYFDLQGRKIRPRATGRYFGRDTLLLK